jgi:hypothetical protein
MGYCLRAYQRQILKDNVSLSTEDGRKETLSLKNLSASGACICHDYSFKKNEFVTITITTQGIFNKRAKVVWSKEVVPNSWEIGLDFNLYPLNFVVSPIKVM